MPTITLPPGYLPATYNLDDKDYWIEGNRLVGDTYVTVGNGNNTWAAFTWAAIFTAGDGNNRVLGSGIYNSFILGNGHNNVALSGDGNYLVVGNGGNTIQVAGVMQDVHCGSGADIVNVTGWASVVQSGGGNDSITLKGLSHTLDSGAGDDRIMITVDEGYWGPDSESKVRAGEGNDIIRYQSGGAFIDGGKGNDTIYIAKFTGEEYEGRLSACVIFDRPGDGIDDVVGDAMSVGNKFDVRQALAATDWDHDLATLSGYLHVVSSGRSTIVSVLESGAPPGAYTDIAIIHQQVTYGEFLDHLYW